MEAKIVMLLAVLGILMTSGCLGICGSIPVVGPIFKMVPVAGPLLFDGGEGMYLGTVSQSLAVAQEIDDQIDDGDLCFSCDEYGVAGCIDGSSKDCDDDVAAYYDQLVKRNKAIEDVHPAGGKKYTCETAWWETVEPSLYGGEQRTKVQVKLLDDQCYVFTTQTSSGKSVNGEGTARVTSFSCYEENRDDEWERQDIEDCDLANKKLD